MIVLDCESAESALLSLASIFRCRPLDIRGALLAIDLDEIYSDDGNTPDVQSWTYLFSHFVAEFGEPLPVDSICWFHCTRSIKSSKFTAGLLTLDQALPFVWAMLIDAVQGAPAAARLRSMRAGGVSNFHYRLKAGNRAHQGPYGFLVRDCAFNPSRLWSHDYLRLPEIVEDICNAYAKKYGEPIDQIYQTALVPCVVKFQSTRGFGLGSLEAAISYAYTCVRDLPPDFGAVYCFDGEGLSVDARDIVSVQYLDD